MRKADKTAEIAEALDRADEKLTAAEASAKTVWPAVLSNLAGGYSGDEANARRADNRRTVETAAKAISEMVAAFSGTTEATEEQARTGEAIIARAYAAGINF